MSEPRECLSVALIELCGECDFEQVTVAGLCERAGVEPAAFAAHFDDLEDCFLEVYVRMRDEFMGAVGSAFAGAQGWRSQMRAAAHAMLVFLVEDEVRARISFVEVLHAGERALLVRDETMRWLFWMIDLGRQEPTAPAHLTIATAEAIGGAIYQRIQAALEQRDLEALVRGTPEMMWFAMLPYLGSELAAEELFVAPPMVAGVGQRRG